MRVDFYQHPLSSAEYGPLIGQVLDSPFLSPRASANVSRRCFCDFFGVSNALLVNSWTNGALAVLLALDVGPGDEVIIPAMTFIATSAGRTAGERNPSLWTSIRNAAADESGGRGRGAQPQSLARLCPSTLRAVWSIGRVSRASPGTSGRRGHRGLRAHCFEGSRDGAVPGQHSTAAIFSFYATKNVTCGEGGAVITNDADLAAKIRQTRLHGMTQGAADRFQRGQYRHWDMELLGVKANLPDVLSAYLPPQIAQRFASGCLFDIRSPTAIATRSSELRFAWRGLPPEMERRTYFPDSRSAARAR